MRPYTYGTRAFADAIDDLFRRGDTLVVFAHFDKLPTRSVWLLFRSRVECESSFLRFVRDRFRLDDTRQSLLNGDLHAYPSMRATMRRVTFYCTLAVDFTEHYDALDTIDTSRGNTTETLIRLLDEENPLLIELRTPTGGRQFTMIEDDDDIRSLGIPADSSLRVFSLDQSYDFPEVVVAKRPLLASDDPELHGLAKRKFREAAADGRRW